MHLLHRIPAWAYAAFAVLMFAAVANNQQTPGKFRCTAVQVATAGSTLVVSGASDHNAWSIQNLGPNDIYCDGLSTVTTATGVRIASSGGFLSADMYGRNGQIANDSIYCIAATALQVTPADTRKCEGY